MKLPILKPPRVSQTQGFLHAVPLLTRLRQPWVSYSLGYKAVQRRLRAYCRPELGLTKVRVRVRVLLAHYGK